MQPGQLVLQVPDGVQVEAGPVVDRRERAAAWRLRLTTDGPHRLVVLAGGREVGQRILGGRELGMAEGQAQVHQRLLLRRKGAVVRQHPGEQVDGLLDVSRHDLRVAGAEEQVRGVRLREGGPGQEEQREPPHAQCVPASG